MDFDECFIKIYRGNKLIVRVDGSYEAVEEMYTIAALRLARWLHFMGENRQHEHIEKLRNMWQAFSSTSEQSGNVQQGLCMETESSDGQELGREAEKGV